MKMITLNLEIAEVNVIIAGLNELTLKQALSTWQKVVTQAQAQTQPASIASDITDATTAD